MLCRLGPGTSHRPIQDTRERTLWLFWIFSYHVPPSGRYTIKLNIYRKYNFKHDFKNATPYVEATWTGHYATGVNSLFQAMNLEKLEFLFLSGSQYLTKEFLINIANRMPSNLTEIWVTLSPQLEIETSTLTNLKNCPKLKKLGFEESNLSGVYSDFLQEFNEEIYLYFYEYQEDCWIDLNQKLMVKDYAENICKITENGQAVAASLWV